MERSTAVADAAVAHDGEPLALGVGHTAALPALDQLAAGVDAIIVNPASPVTDGVAQNARLAASRLAIELRTYEASDPSLIDTAFEHMASDGVRALVISSDGLFINQAAKLAALCARRSIGAVFQNRSFAAAGGLASYGGGFSEAYRLAGAYAGRILKGEKPADLPVQQATRIELVLNLNTAQSLGLTIPITLLGRADEVIE